MDKKDVELELLDGKPKQDDVQERAVWSRKAEYMLSLIGYTVGLGSVWRFPYLCMRNGGGAFLIPFIVFMILCGFPLYFLELALGQFSGKSPLVVWIICPLFKGLGYCSVAISFIATWYYGLVIAWILCYLFYSFYPTQPWSTCDNEWNSPNCISSRTRDLLNKSENFNYTNMPLGKTNASSDFYPTAANEFWRFRILNESKGLEDWGKIQWHLALALFLSFAVCFLCIIKGVKSVGKVVYVTAVLPYILLTVILINNMTLDGAVDGVLYLLKPDFSKLINFQVWVEAALQVFYSLGPAWGGVITMASYNRFNNKCLSAILCGLTVFSVVGFLAHEAGMTIPEIAESGPGLVFQAYPEALARLPVPQLWAVLFFVMLFTVGMDSQFGMMETVISGFADMFPKTLGKRKMLLVLAVFAIYMLTGLIFATQAGVYIFQLIDWYASVFVIFLTSLLECVVIGYVYGAERFSRDIELMVGYRLPILLRISWCFLTPLAMIMALTATLVNYEHPTYKGYVYPQYISFIGIMIALVSVLPIPVIAVYELITTRGSLKQRVKSLIIPARSWAPNDEDTRYSYKMFKYGDNFWRNIKYDIIGR